MTFPAPDAASDRCDLCGDSPLQPRPPAQGRRLAQCPRCRQIRVDPAQWPTPAAEKARYDLHQNRWDNPDYRAYLGRIAAQFQGVCPQARRILDFGSGPEAVLTRLLREVGLDAHACDPLYNRPPPPPDTPPFDAIILCEVFEHLRDPRAELARLRPRLAPGGALFLRTEFHLPSRPLPTWPYLNDPTHLRFIAPDTLPFIARLLDCPTHQSDRRGWALFSRSPLKEIDLCPSSDTI